MPTMDRLADERADLLAVAHDGAVLADAVGVPDRPQPPPERLRVDLRDLDRLPRLQLAHPAARTRRWRPSCATPAGARSGSARTTTSRSTSGRWARRRRTGRSGRATTASTASSAARRTTGIPTSPRTTTTSTSPTCPRTATTSPRTWPTRRCEFIRDSKQTEPDKPWYLWFCPGANHAPHHAPQEYIDKYKGKFDDGYEAYREWVLPRMIERGILPEGTELTPINPMPEGTFSAGRRGAPVGHAVRRREGAVLAAWPRSTPASREYTDAPGRADRRLPRGVRASSTTR